MDESKHESRETSSASPVIEALKRDLQQLLPEQAAFLQQACARMQAIQMAAFDKVTLETPSSKDQPEGSALPSTLLLELRKHFLRHRGISEAQLLALGQKFVADHPRWSLVASDVSKLSRHAVLQRYPLHTHIYLDSMRLWAQRLQQHVVTSDQDFLLVRCDLEAGVPKCVLMELGAMKAMRRKCSGPECRRTDTNNCARCKCRSYCSSACQRADWTRHKTECKATLADVYDALWEIALYQHPPLVFVYSETMTLKQHVSAKQVVEYAARIPVWQEALRKARGKASPDKSAESVA